MDHLTSSQMASLLKAQQGELDAVEMYRHLAQTVSQDTDRTTFEKPAMLRFFSPIPTRSSPPNTLKLPLSLFCIALLDASACTTLSLKANLRLLKPTHISSMIFPMLRPSNRMSKSTAIKYFSFSKNQLTQCEMLPHRKPYPQIPMKHFHHPRT